jgi:acyl carrier protein
MNRHQQILTMVRDFVRDHGRANADEITPETPLGELGIDSLLTIDLLFRFEDAFKIDIPLEDFKARTVGDAMSFLDGLLPPEGAAA